MAPSDRPRRAAPAARDLERYRAKRSAGRTPEPFAGRRLGGSRYVVQQHGARRLHYDLRLEWGGVLLSWAVPKGPSLDPAERRLAVRVEDHPVDYAGFEGVIPAGEYGAGPVIVWDLGTWQPLSDPDEGLAQGKLDFLLRGHKLRGRFALVRTRGSGNEWLLLKKADAFASAEAEPGARSVLSGLTLDEVAAPRVEERLLRRLARCGALRRRVRAANVQLMLAETAKRPFSAKGWAFELKLDGWRVLAERSDGRVSLRTRNGIEIGPRFPELTVALSALPCHHAVIDGELTVLDAAGRPSFSALQARLGGASADPVVLYAFDLLGFGDYDLRALPLAERRACLELLLPAQGPVQPVDSFAERGEEVFREVLRLGFEGLVAKRLDAPYRGGRQPAWRKLAVARTGDFAVVGYRRGRGVRAALGALHLAGREDGGLRYVGRVGSGLGDESVRALLEALEPLRRDTAPCRDAPEDGEACWTEPRFVAEVRYTEWTRDGRLRKPVFLRLRPDKTLGEVDPARRGGSAEDVPAAGRGGGAEDATGAPHAAAKRGASPTVAVAPRVVELSNEDKVFWPGEGIRKRDLVAYYDAVAPWLLPQLRDRPLVVVRYPDGIGGKHFFQKNAPEWTPGWVRTEELWSEHAGRETRYFVCDDRETLRFVVNGGAIPLHVWASRVGSLERPDWCVLDLDPKGAPFAHVVRLARALHDLAEELGLPTFVKTSGSTGLHVLVPLARRLDFSQARVLAELLARVVVERHPDVGTTARALRARHGRVYIDTGQNGHGKLLVAPYSVRPLPGAPVSMPLHWREVGPRLGPTRFHLRMAPARMRRLGDDPWAGLLECQPDLLGALARLRERIAPR